MRSDLRTQRAVTRIALAGLRDSEFALAGSGAIREHGVTRRLTEDVDLFTPRLDAAAFDTAVDQVVHQLRHHGYRVTTVRRALHFARLSVEAGEDERLDVDLGVDWREHPAVTLEVGPVLSLDDAVFAKVSALYSRAEPRDFLDVDAIRAFGRFTDDELVAGAARRDPGFETGMFVEQLQIVRRIRAIEVAPYGVTEAQWRSVQERTTRWAASLRVGQTPSAPGPVVEPRRASLSGRPSGAAPGPAPRDAPERPSGAARPGPDLGR